MNIPDYISPVVGYRVWRWNAAGLNSVCGTLWPPGQPLEAVCKISSCKTLGGRAAESSACHPAPQRDCMCGVYAAKTIHHLCSAGYDGYGIHGEVYLWGKVVEHQLGWRAQFAYPRTLFIPPHALPFTLAEIQPRLQALISYGCDISVVYGGTSINLWRKDLGLDATGLDYLMSRGKEWYANRRLKRGDRVAVLSQGIAVVEQVEGNWIQAVLWNRSVLRIGRKEIVWNEQNMRWEKGPHSCCEANAKS